MLSFRSCLVASALLVLTAVPGSAQESYLQSYEAPSGGTGAYSPADVARFQAFIADYKRGLFLPTDVSGPTRQIVLQYLDPFNAQYAEKFYAIRASGRPLTAHEQAMLNLYTNQVPTVLQEIQTNGKLSRYR